MKLLINKILDTSGLVTTTVLNTKISEFENKIRNATSLVTTTVSNTEISEVENKIPDNSKHIASHEFHKLRAEDFAIRLTETSLLNKTL